jgi:hypothetical protein
VITIQNQYWLTSRLKRSNRSSLCSSTSSRKVESWSKWCVTSNNATNILGCLFRFSLELKYETAHYRSRLCSHVRCHPSLRYHHRLLRKNTDRRAQIERCVSPVLNVYFQRLTGRNRCFQSSSRTFMTYQVQAYLVLSILLKVGMSHSRNVFPSSIQPSPTRTD